MGWPKRYFYWSISLIHKERYDSRRYPPSTFWRPLKNCNIQSRACFSAAIFLWTITWKNCKYYYLLLLIYELQIFLVPVLLTGSKILDKYDRNSAELLQYFSLWILEEIFELSFDIIRRPFAEFRSIDRWFRSHTARYSLTIVLMKWSLELKYGRDFLIYLSKYGIKRNRKFNRICHGHFLVFHWWSVVRDFWFDQRINQFFTMHFI